MLLPPDLIDTESEPTLKQKREKQLQAIIFALENYPNINRRKLMMYIFYIDLFCFNNYGYTLLEDVYYKLSNPVPAYGFYLTIDTTNFTKEELEEHQMTLKLLEEGY